MSKLLQSHKFKHDPTKIQKLVIKLYENINFAVSMGSKIDPDLYRDIVKQLEKINVELANLGQELREFDYEYQVLKARCSKK